MFIFCNKTDENKGLTLDERWGTWPEFVFSENYKLLPLVELEKIIKEIKHLPGIPSAKEIASNGINIGELQSKLLRKIEELTLYIIDLKKENEKLKTRVNKLEKKNGKKR